MCDLFGHSTTTSTAAAEMMTEGMLHGIEDVPDMDALLDQMECKENEYQQQREGRISRSSSHSNAEHECAQEALAQKLDENGAEEEEEPPLIDFFSPVVEPPTPINKTEAETTSQTAILDEQIAPDCTGTPTENGQQDDDDIYDQIDQMDALIRAEEEKLAAVEAAEQVAMSNGMEDRQPQMAEEEEEQREKGASISAPTPVGQPSSPVGRFVDEIVGRLLGQAIVESHAVPPKSIRYTTPHEHCDFYATAPSNKKAASPFPHEHVENGDDDSKAQKNADNAEDVEMENGEKWHEPIRIGQQQEGKDEEEGPMDEAILVSNMSNNNEGGERIKKGEEEEKRVDEEEEERIKKEKEEKRVDEEEEERVEKEEEEEEGPMDEGILLVSKMMNKEGGERIKTEEEKKIDEEERIEKEEEEERIEKEEDEKRVDEEEEEERTAEEEEDGKEEDEMKDDEEEEKIEKEGDEKIIVEEKRTAEEEEDETELEKIIEAERRIDDEEDGPAERECHQHQISTQTNESGEMLIDEDKDGEENKGGGERETEEVTAPAVDESLGPAHSANDEEEEAKIIEQLEAELLQQENDNEQEEQAKMTGNKESPKQDEPATAPSSSSSSSSHPPKHPLATVHDLSMGLDEFKLTESELILGKRKPNWIPDDDCPNCMLCSTRFSLVNRRHHCRACGRVLCRSCCFKRRQLAYMDEREGKQRVCDPCNRTLNLIEEYEQRIQQQRGTNSIDSLKRVQQNAGENEGGLSSSRYEDNGGARKTKSLLKPPRLKSTTSSIGQQTNGGGESSSTTEATTTDGREGNEDECPFSPKITIGHQNEEERRRDRPTDIEMLNSGHQSQSEETTGKRRTSIADGESDDQRGAALLLPTSIHQQQRLLSTSSANSNASGKRQVTFRDGVNPGQETPSPSGGAGSSHQCAGTNIDGSVGTSSLLNPYQWLVNSGASGQTTPNGSADESGETAHREHTSSGKKLPRKVSRRTKERRVLEEQASLLQLDHWRVCVLVDGQDQHQRLGGELRPRALDQVVGQLLPETGESAASVHIAIRRNFHVRVEWRKEFSVGQLQMEVLSFVTQGMSAIGCDELMLVLQLDRGKFSIPEEIEADFFCAMEQFEHIFLTCLNPTGESMDHRMGIRKCVNRMARLFYPLAKRRKTLMGHPTSAIQFHRPRGQHFSQLHCPSGPFLLGTLIREEELAWAKSNPSRLLLRLGLLSGQYPTPLVNLIREQPVFTREAVQSSVLKVLNDFRNWAYQMTQLAGTAIMVRDDSTEILLSSMALDEVRTLVESNRNMVGWAINELAAVEQEMEVDSHLVCEQTADGHFCTRIFAGNMAEKRKATGASFVIFDGALKGGEQFLVTICEDGLVIRLHADLMEELVKALLAGDSFMATNSQGHRLNVQFQSSITPAALPTAATRQRVQPLLGALVSPIDGLPLDGQFQYGLQLSRQLHAFNFFQYSSEWALRLASVINILPGKWPSALQPRFFDVCEQLAQQVANTVEPFLQELIVSNQLSIALRVHVDEDAVSYDTEKWAALPDQHFVWTVTLDEQIIPFLYSLCAWVPSGFHVELHLPILSIRPLPAMTVPNSPVDCTTTEEGAK